MKKIYPGFICLQVIVTACEKNSPNAPEIPKIPPVVITGQFQVVDAYTVKVSGEVTTDGNASVTERGVVYGTAPNLTSANSKITTGNGVGTF